MEEKEFSLRQATNAVSGTGYLKEFSLDYQTTDDNVIIKGDITIAVDEKVGYKLRVYCPKKNNDGSERDMFNELDKYIKQAAEINSISNLLRDNPSASIEDVMSRAKRVYVLGSLAPYEYLNDKDIVETRKDVKLSFIGDAKEDKAFEPGLRFKLEVFVNSLKVEEDEAGNPTGRGIMTATLPLYRNDVATLDIIVPAEVKEDVFRIYSAGVTSRIFGEFTTVITEREEDPNKNLAFGKAPSEGPVTRSKVFLTITGGDHPYGVQNEKSYKKEDIEAAREMKIEKLQKEKLEYNSKKEKAETPVQVKTGFKFA